MASLSSFSIILIHRTLEVGSRGKSACSPPPTSELACPKVRRLDLSIDAGGGPASCYTKPKRAKLAWQLGLSGVPQTGGAS